jgi:hypothetical protein
MRAQGNLHRPQMKTIDSRMGELFRHLRRAIDVLEQITSHPYLSSAPERQPRKPPENSPTRRRVPSRSGPTLSKKLAH